MTSPAIGERLRRANRASLATATCLMVWMLALAQGTGVPEGFLQRSALLLVAVHACAHVFALRGLRALVAQGVPEAATMLAVYRHPRRISQADLAVGWAAFYLAVRIVGLAEIPAAVPH